MARPRGFIEEWRMQPHVEQLVDNVQSTLLDCEDILPLTIRQIFYMLVSNYYYEKAEKSYKRLCEALNKARRARIIDMDSIRDDGLTREEIRGWGSEQGFKNYVTRQAGNFTLGRQDNQPIKTYVWCEAGGMVPQLLDAVSDWHIPVLSSGGFDSVTTKHNFAKEISDNEHTVILHLGDHDPSGVHMFGSLDEDLQAFVDAYGGSLELKRIAVTPEQVSEMRLPTAPPKPTDRRSFSGLTTQCEAIHPRDLRKIVQRACEEHIDFDTYNETLVKEKEISERLTKIYGSL